MRTYLSTGFRTLAGGAIEVEARWSGVRWIALALLPVLFFGMRSPTVLGLVGAAAVYLFVFPARRRVVFDPAKARLRVEHAGAFAERGTLAIPFSDLHGLVFEEAGRRGGRDQHALYARTERGRIYLLTHAGRREAEELAARVEALVH